MKSAQITLCYLLLLLAVLSATSKHGPDIRPIKYQVWYGTKLPGQYITNLYNVKKAFICMAHCHGHPVCLSCNYRGRDGLCQLLWDRVARANDTRLTTDENFIYMFQERSCKVRVDHTYVYYYTQK